jgi:tRNA(adenine34) deaminase
VNIGALFLLRTKAGGAQFASLVLSKDSIRLREALMAHKKTQSKQTKSKRTTNKRSPAKKSHRKGSDSKWSSKVQTVSTYPPKDLYTKDATTIARVMATKKVSPKGLGSAIRMVQFYINRAGKNLSAMRLRELEKAKRLLQEKRDGASRKQS